MFSNYNFQFLRDEESCFSMNFLLCVNLDFDSDFDLRDFGVGDFDIRDFDLGDYGIDFDLDFGVGDFG